MPRGIVRQCNRELLPQIIGGRECLADEGVAQPLLEEAEFCDSAYDLNHPSPIGQYGGVGEQVLLLLFSPGIIVRDDPNEDILSRRLRRFDFASSDAAFTFFGDEAVAVSDDA